MGLCVCARSSPYPGGGAEWVAGIRATRQGSMEGGVSHQQAALEAQPSSRVPGRARQPQATDAGWDTRGQAVTWCTAPLCPPLSPLCPATLLQQLMCQPQCQPRGMAQLWDMAQLWGMAQLWDIAQLCIMTWPCPCTVPSGSGHHLTVPSTCSTPTSLHRGCSCSLTQGQGHIRHHPTSSSLTTSVFPGFPLCPE